MGMQQILLIVLSVIIVGVAVAVGITMFGAQATSSNRSAIIGDMNNFAASAMAYYKTPTSMAGAGSPTNWGDVTLSDVGYWIGFDFNGTDSLGTGNGSFKISIVSPNFEIIGNGTEKGRDAAYAVTGNGSAGSVEAVLTLEPDGTITTVVNN